MRKSFSYLLAFSFGVLAALLGWVVDPPVHAGDSSPLGIDPQCKDCSPFAVKVKLSHYNPAIYNTMYPQLNCWNYDEARKWCLSPVWIGVPWEAVWGYGAACPAEWPVGAWVVVPGVGQFVCLDHGGDIACDKSGRCGVDVLGPGGSAWDGQEYDATMLVPKSYLYRLQDRMKSDE